VFVSYDQTWMDQDSSWWTKANRAKVHIDSLRRQVDGYRVSAPYSLTPELTAKPDRLAYRLRFSKPVPVTVGDVLHNLRAALESLAFEVARRSQGGTLTAEQEKESTFPICEIPTTLMPSSRARDGCMTTGPARRSGRSSPSCTSNKRTGSALRWTGASRRHSAGVNCTASTPCGTSTSTGD
jgi:hypothetical protein